MKKWENKINKRIKVLNATIMNKYNRHGETYRFLISKADFSPHKPIVTLNINIGNFMIQIDSTADILFLDARSVANILRDMIINELSYSLENIKGVKCERKNS